MINEYFIKRLDETAHVEIRSLLDNFGAMVAQSGLRCGGFSVQIPVYILCHAKVATSVISGNLDQHMDLSQLPTGPETQCSCLIKMFLRALKRGSGAFRGPSCCWLISATNTTPKNRKVKSACLI